MLSTALFPLGLLAGSFAPDWTYQHFGKAFEAWMLVGFGGALALVVWMFVHCATSRALDRAQKNRWYGLLLVGGPITASAYLWRELHDSPRGS